MKGTAHGSSRREFARWAARAGAVASVFALLPGCERGAPPPSPDPNPLRVGVSLASGRPAAAIAASFRPLVEHLGRSLGVRAELVVAPTAADLNERFHRGELDLAYLASVDFVRAEQRDAAAPLAMRTLDARFHCVVIARPELAGGKFPEDFRGHRFLFGGAESNSGARMPRYFFEQMRLVPEQLFATVGSRPTHFAVIEAVEAGEADAGVVNGPLFQRRLSRNPDDPRHARVVWTSPPFVDALWAAPARTSAAWRERVLEIFLALSPDNPAHGEIMVRLSARGFVPAARVNLDSVREALAESHRPPTR